MESLFDNVLHYNYKDFSDSSAVAIPTGSAVDGLVLVRSSKDSSLDVVQLFSGFFVYH